MPEERKGHQQPVLKKNNGDAPGRHPRESIIELQVFL